MTQSSTPGVAIATISWARDAAEEALLRESLTALCNLNLPVFICDGGSPEGFTRFLHALPNATVVPPAKGLVMQTLTSLQAASNAGFEFVFYTEPDKFDFFNDHLPGFLASCQTSKHTGVVLASRNTAAFHTFPAMQVATETAINKCCVEVVGVEGDYTYGPFLLNSRLVPLLATLTNDTGWGWRPYAFNIAVRLGFLLQKIEGPYNCPPAARTDTTEDRLYRMKQLVQNINGLLLSTKANLHL